jgi:TIR domain
MQTTDLKVIVRTELPNRSLTCKGIGEILTNNKSLILVTSADTPEAIQSALDLERSLLAFLLALPGAKESIVGCGGAPPSLQCHAFGEIHTPKLLVLVGDRVRPVPQTPLIMEWERRLVSQQPNYFCLPLFPAGSRISADNLLPGFYLRLNASFWSGDVSEALSLILQKVRLTPPDPRIFISYKRDDAQELANQLFNELVRHGFTPFLDLYSVDPGENFQDVLHEHLADKSFVLVLESTRICGSKWVNEEIDFTRENGLGLMALNLDPNVTLPGVGEDRRYRLYPADYEGKVLSRFALDQLVVRIKLLHERAVFLRVQQLSNSFIALLLLKALARPLHVASGISGVPEGTLPQSQGGLDVLDDESASQAG